VKNFAEVRNFACHRIRIRKQDHIQIRVPQHVAGQEKGVAHSTWSRETCEGISEFISGH